MGGALTEGGRSWVNDRDSYSGREVLGVWEALSYVREVLGEWEALTQRERGPGCVGGTHSVREVLGVWEVLSQQEGGPG